MGRKNARRCAVLYALYRDARYCAWYWPSHHVIAQVEAWRALRDQAQSERRRRIYGALIAGARHGIKVTRISHWERPWILHGFHADAPPWAVRGLGHKLVDDINEDYQPVWKSIRYIHCDESVASICDQVYVQEEGWHTWTVKPGKNAQYHGCHKEPRAADGGDGSNDVAGMS